MQPYLLQTADNAGYKLMSSKKKKSHFPSDKQFDYIITLYVCIDEVSQSNNVRSKSSGYPLQLIWVSLSSDSSELQWLNDLYWTPFTKCYSLLPSK